jgi:hypothetical protein
MNLTSCSNTVFSVKVKAMAILKTRTHNERAEIEFELDYLASLTTQQRFEMMLQKSREMASLSKDYSDYQKNVKPIIRQRSASARAALRGRHSYRPD